MDDPECTDLVVKGASAHSQARGSAGYIPSLNGQSALDVEALNIPEGQPRLIGTLTRRLRGVFQP